MQYLNSDVFYEIYPQALSVAPGNQWHVKRFCMMKYRLAYPYRNCSMTDILIFSGVQTFKSTLHFALIIWIMTTMVVASRGHAISAMFYAALSAGLCFVNNLDAHVIKLRCAAHPACQITCDFCPNFYFCSTLFV
jgi:hypothetical protein